MIAALVEENARRLALDFTHCPVVAAVPGPLGTRSESQGWGQGAEAALTAPGLTEEHNLGPKSYLQRLSETGFGPFFRQPQKRNF